MNPQMFNSFLDGTKSAIEMAAVANACDLRPPDDGLGFPACGVDDLPHILRPKSAGGILEHEGIVEVISALSETVDQSSETCVGECMLCLLHPLIIQSVALQNMV